MSNDQQQTRPVLFRGGGFLPERIRWVGPLVFLVLLFFVEVGTRLGWISNLTMPKPSAVLDTLLNLY
ncbi:MAG: hypothetical protein ACO2ZD_14100, partial [Pseudomonadales bacterium]